MILSSAGGGFRCVIRMERGRDRHFGDPPYALADTSCGGVEAIRRQALSACLRSPGFRRQRPWPRRSRGRLLPAHAFWPTHSRLQRGFPRFQSLEAHSRSNLRSTNRPLQQAEDFARWFQTPSCPPSATRPPLCPEGPWLLRARHSLSRSRRSGLPSSRPMSDPGPCRSPNSQSPQTPSLISLVRLLTASPTETSLSRMLSVPACNSELAEAVDRRI
jgi:hypothetical protein